jgi:hypothetical protein
MNLLTDDKLTTSDEILARIASIERKRERMNGVISRDFRKREDEFKRMARRLDSLRDRLKSMPQEERAEPRKQSITTGQPLPRDANGNIQWDAFLRSLDEGEIVIMPNFFREDVTQAASLAGVKIGTCDQRNGTFSALICPSNDEREGPPTKTSTEANQ